jgi:Raf kinase inhibitor-like YbhB/YbcL family protein
MTLFRLLALLLALPFTFALVGCPPGTGSGSDDDDSAGDDDDAMDDDDATPVDFAMWSPDFVDPYFDNPRDCELALPVENACFNPNPEIVWEGAPEGTVAFALIFDDPTAGDFPHWAIYNIPGGETGLDAGISGDGATSSPPSGSVELNNGFGSAGYLGSCPQAVNQYRWRLWALSEEIDSSPANYDAVEAAAEAVSLDMVEMCHVFDGANSPMGR